MKPLTILAWFGFLSSFGMHYILSWLAMDYMTSSHGLHPYLALAGSLLWLVVQYHLAKIVDFIEQLEDAMLKVITNIDQYRLSKQYEPPDALEYLRKL